MARLNSIGRRIVCNDVHNMILVARLAHPLSNTTTTIGAYLFFASFGFTGALLIFRLSTHIPFSIQKFLCVRWCGEKIVGCSMLFPLLTATFLLLHDPSVIDEGHSQFAPEIVDGWNLNHLHRPPDEVLVGQENVDL